MAALNCRCRYGTFFSTTQRRRLFLSSIGLIIVQDRFYSRIIPRRLRRKRIEGKDRFTVLKVLASTVEHVPNRPHYQLISDELLNPKALDYKAEIFNAIDDGFTFAECLIEKYPRLSSLHVSVPAWAKTETVMKKVKKQTKVEVTVDNLRLLMKEGENIVKVAALYEKLDCEGDISFDLSKDVLDYLTFHTVSSESGNVQKEWNLPDKLFNKLKMNNANARTRTFEVYILGLLRCGETLKAFEIYREMKEKNVFGSLFMYNTLLSRICDVTNSSDEDRWNLALDIVDSIVRCNIKPNLETFNSLMDVASESARSPMLCLQLVREMRSLNISPSLGSYYFLLLNAMKQKFNFAPVLYCVLDELKNGSVECSLHHPSDKYFFNVAMSLARKLTDDDKRNEIAIDLFKFVFKNDLMHLMHRDFFQNFMRVIVEGSTDVNFVFKVHRKLVPKFILPKGYNFELLFNFMRDKKDITHLPTLYMDMVSQQTPHHDATINAMFSAIEDNNIPKERCEEFLSVAQRADSCMEQTTKERTSVIIKLLCLCGKYLEAKETMEECITLNNTPNVDAIHSVFKLAIENSDKHYALDLKKTMTRHNVEFTDVFEKMLSNIDEIT